MSVIVATWFGPYTMTNRNCFIKISSLEKICHFDLYLTFNDSLILVFFTIIFQIEEKIKPDTLVHHLLQSDL